MELSNRCKWAVMVLLAAGVAAGTGAAFGRIKLITLPARERVEIQLDNPQATLLEEERIVTLLAGTNNIDFSWSNAAIDKDTIQFRVVDMPLRARKADDPPSLVRPDGKVETIRVIHVAYPPNENALVWEVFAEQPAAARVRISYLISNLNRTFNYRAVAEQDESTLLLNNFIRLENFSGEEFGSSGIWAGFGGYFHREVGLNESKQMLIGKFAGVPIKKIYTFNWWTCPAVPDEPEQRYVEMRYVMTNDKAHKLGEFPLQYGKARIFQKDGRGGEAFLGEDWGQFTPVDDDLKLYLGLARDVVVKRKLTKNERHPVQGNLYNQEVTVEYRIENCKPDALTLDIVEDMNRLRDEVCGGPKGYDAQWEVVREGSSLGKDQVERKDSRTGICHIPLEARPKGDEKLTPKVVTIHIMFKNEW